MCRRCVAGVSFHSEHSSLRGGPSKRLPSRCASRMEAKCFVSGETSEKGETILKMEWYYGVSRNQNSKIHVEKQNLTSHRTPYIPIPAGTFHTSPTWLSHPSHITLTTGSSCHLGSSWQPQGGSQPKMLPNNSNVAPSCRATLHRAVGFPRRPGHPTAQPGCHECCLYLTLPVCIFLRTCAGPRPRLFPRADGIPAALLNGLAASQRLGQRSRNTGRCSC